MAIRKYKRKDQNGNICAPMTTAEQVITANENVNLANTLGYLDRADVSSDSFHINKFVANGIIQLYGEHTNTNKGLPIQNASSGHTISGKLFVLDSTINEREVCVTQVLMLSNRVGNDGALYIRTGSATSKASLQDPNSTSWGGWQKQQGLKEMNVVYDVMDIDKYTDNGMYSGIVVNSTNAMVGGLTIETGSTFLIVTLNGYASEKINKYLTPQCTQMLYLVASGLDVNTGETKLKPAQIYTRTGLWTGTMYSWGDWNNITQENTQATYTELTYSELKTLRDKGQLNGGQLYRITDYTTTTTQDGTISAQHDFDIVVRALSDDTLGEEAWAVKKVGDNYFANSDVEAWEIKYCLDNDTNRFAWADAVNGKGVIYYMKDEFNNECPYDFKNIKMVSSKGYYMFTFDYEGEDYSIVANNPTNAVRCYGNSIKPYYDGVQKINFITISSSSVYNQCYCNSFGVNNSFISTNAMAYAAFGESVRGIDVLAKYAYHLTIASNNLGQEDYSFEIDDKVFELYNVKIESGVINGSGYLLLATDPSFRTIVERDKDSNLNVYSDLYGKLKTLSDDVDELKNATLDELKEADNSGYDNQANLVGYFGTLRNYGVRGENIDIKTITAYARSGSVSDTPLYCKMLIRVNSSWVKLFESEEPKALNLSDGAPIVFNLTKKVDIALTDKDLVAIVFHTDKTSAANKYSATGMKTISIAGALTGSDGDLGLNPSTQSGWAPAFSFTYEINDEASKTLHSDRDEVVNSIKTFNNTIKANQGVLINDKTLIAPNIDGGELKVLHNNSTKGFIVRTRNTDDDILPLELLSTNGTYSFTYTFPAKGGEIALLEDVISSTDESVMFLSLERNYDEQGANVVDEHLYLYSNEEIEEDDIRFARQSANCRVKCGYFENEDGEECDRYKRNSGWSFYRRSGHTPYEPLANFVGFKLIKTDFEKTMYGCPYRYEVYIQQNENEDSIVPFKMVHFVPRFVRYSLKDEDRLYFMKKGYRAHPLVHNTTVRQRAAFLIKNKMVQFDFGCIANVSGDAQGISDLRFFISPK